MADSSNLKLGPTHQKELEQFLETQQAQARVQSQILKHASICWDKCVGSISSSFSAKERACLGNCVERFFDASNFFIKKIEDQQRALMSPQ